MIAPSASQYTIKQRLLMLWQHKRQYVLCFGGMILGGILLLIFFTVAQVKTLYHKVSGENGATVTNVYTTIIAPGNGTIANATLTKDKNGTTNLNATSSSPPTGQIKANSSLEVKKHELEQHEDNHFHLLDDKYIREHKNQMWGILGTNQIQKRQKSSDKSNHYVNLRWHKQ